ncbi:TPA: hypothetical protein ACJX75_000062 [Pseudomonas aeruginosa]
MRKIALSLSGVWLKQKKNIPPAARWDLPAGWSGPDLRDVLDAR